MHDKANSIALSIAVNMAQIMAWSSSWWHCRVVATTLFIGPARGSVKSCTYTPDSAPTKPVHSPTAGKSSHNLGDCSTWDKQGGNRHDQLPRQFLLLQQLRPSPKNSLCSFCTHCEGLCSTEFTMKFSAQLVSNYQRAE